MLNFIYSRRNKMCTILLVGKTENKKKKYGHLELHNNKIRCGDFTDVTCTYICKTS
jgi:hypothetical protein